MPFLLSVISEGLQQDGEVPHLCFQGLGNGRHEWEAGDSYRLLKSREGEPDSWRPPPESFHN